MTLRDATHAILGSDEPAEWIKLADMYISAYKQMPDSFVLPAQYSILKPVIEVFHSDTRTFVKYIQAIRDQLPPGENKVRLQRVYRTILTRVVQRDRRARFEHALSVIADMMGRKLESDERERVMVKLEQHWAHRRTELLNSARGNTSRGRLSADERAELLHQFWEQIDTEIAHRELPMFKL